MSHVDVSPEITVVQVIQESDTVVQVIDEPDQVVVVTSVGEQGRPGSPGEPGDKGDKGDQGDRGESGAVQDSFTYEHTQAIVSDTWDIVHNLGGRPNVTTVDSTDRIVYGSVEYVSDDEVIVTFASEFSGSAYLS